jgi:hypothetical protein
MKIYLLIMVMVSVMMYRCKILFYLIKIKVVFNFSQPAAVNYSQQRSSSFGGHRSSIKVEKEYLTQYEK